jgi:hypothetical protein
MSPWAMFVGAQHIEAGLVQTTAAGQRTNLRNKTAAPGPQWRRLRPGSERAGRLMSENPQAPEDPKAPEDPPAEGGGWPGC